MPVGYLSAIIAPLQKLEVGDIIHTYGSPEKAAFYEGFL